MKTAHTPGPWECVRWEDGADGSFSSWRILGTTPTGVEGCYSVAEIINGNGYEQNAANARLIAAAPALLEALQSVLSLIDAIADGRLPSSLMVADFRTSISPDSKSLYDSARAAIARATA